MKKIFSVLVFLTISQISFAGSLDYKGLEKISKNNTFMDGEGIPYPDDKINDKKNTYFKNIDSEVLEFHIAHNEGNYFCTNDQLKEIEDNEQVAINYCDKEGKTEEKFNPNGSIKNIAGIFNKEKNVLGMMPHPERMIDPSLSGEDGSLFFNNLINNLK